MIRIFIIILIPLLLIGCQSNNDPINYFSQNHMYKMEDGTILPTFDDGPNENTSYILDKLKEYNIKAAFFVIGRNAEKYPEILQRIVNEGHYLGNHTYNHTRIKSSSLFNLENEIIQTQNIISKYTILKWFRPPCGEISMEMDKWLYDNGYTVVRWTVGGSTSMDLKLGDIILMHDHDNMSELDLKLNQIKNAMN
jgi:peptidoglycan/xylan/chitin deacetylase (PgdA/CDA1 family)